MASQGSAVDEVLVRSLNSAEATLDSCGGKGLNLARLVRAGFAVPPGFVLVTDAYRRFVAVHGLGALIEAACEGLDPSDAVALETASKAIREAFATGGVPEDIQDAVRAAWQSTFAADAAVAVRSSATAEDLPDLSFAGQQDTFLNIVGVEAALAAVVGCWSSLWTARAIGYRIRNDVPPDDVALAVVVQLLVPADVSGVLFTANPLTGARHEVVIDATFGLGEALVSGQVEPDQIVVDTATCGITRTVGAKAVTTVPLAGGGVATSTRDNDDRPALTDDQVRELARLGGAVAAAFGGPQDVEWAIAGGAVHLLQARPITSLFPVPAGDADAVWLSFGAVQGLLQPITPLGRDVVNLVLSGASTLVGARTDLAGAGFLQAAGERLWIRVDGILRHPWGARFWPRLLPIAEPGSAPILAELAREKGWSTPAGRPSSGTVLGAARLVSQVLPRSAPTLVDPTRRRLGAQSRVDQIVADSAARLAEASLVKDAGARLAARVRLSRQLLADSLPRVFRTFLPVMAPGMGMLAGLNAAASEGGDRAQILAMEVLRGLPGNVTTEMDLALWGVAATIQSDPEALAVVRDSDAETLAALYAAGGLPGGTQQALAAFLAEYGMRGVGEIDLGQPRWREDPIHTLATLQGYLQITDPERAPDVVFARGAQAAERAGEELVGLLTAGGGIRAAAKAARLRFMIDRLRKLMGVRETPKFTLIRLFGLVREGLLASGRDLVDAGVLTSDDDVFYLHLDELERLPQEAAQPWAAVVDARRQVAARERRRRQVPRVIAGDGRAFYEGLGSGDAAVSGSPVSPGVVEGLVRVVLDPQASHLLPGEILVCRGTDPAWTPLFLTAGGLVTEVGGMMTHGSVVAREYGIPAVVGVHEATTRLTTGQRVRLDGTTGAIEVLDDDA